MNRRIGHRDAFARLALLAALLLAVVPTLGRMLAPASAHGASPTAHAHATAHGMDTAMVRAMGHAAPTEHAHHPAPSPDHPGQHQHDADCAYCPLLATTVLAPMQTLALALAPLPASPPSRTASARVTERFHGSLGSRGPPIA